MNSLQMVKGLWLVLASVGHRRRRIAWDVAVTDQSVRYGGMSKLPGESTREPLSYSLPAVVLVAVFLGLIGILVGGALAGIPLGGGAVAAAKYGYVVEWRQSGTFEQKSWFIPLLIGTTLLLAAVGYLAGWGLNNTLVKGDKLLVRFDARVGAQRIDMVRGGRRVLCVACALLPVFLLYSSLVAWHLRR